MALRRVLALIFGRDFIHWRRCGELWPRVWPGRLLLFLTNAPAAVAARVRGRGAALGLAELTVRALRRVLALIFGRDFILRARLYPLAAVRRDSGRGDRASGRAGFCCF